MKALQSIKNNIPNTITCLNLVSGCLAIMFAFNYDKCYGALHGYEMVYICIAAAAVFGGIDIFLPENVNVKISSNSVFGGVSEKKHRAPVDGNATVYINATGMFGGVDIK